MPPKRLPYFAIVCGFAFLSIIAIMRPSSPPTQPNANILSTAYDPRYQAADGLAYIYNRDNAELRRIAESVLVSYPLSGLPFKILAYLSWIEGDHASSQRRLELAFHRTFRDIQINLSLIKISLGNSTTTSVAQYIDATLRTDPNLFPEMSQLILLLSGDPAFRADLTEALRFHPSWRTAFLQALRTEDNHLENYIAIMFSLLNSNDLSDVESDTFTAVLLNRDMIDEALTVWYRTRDSRSTDFTELLYNGNFRLAVNDSPFNWRIGSPPNAIIQILKDPNGLSDILNVRFLSRRGHFAHLEQKLALLPGMYTLSGEFQNFGYRSDYGIAWKIYCNARAPSTGEIGNLIETGGTWKSFSGRFRIPQHACKSQTLRLEMLARNSADQIASGEISFRHLVIHRND